MKPAASMRRCSRTTRGTLYLANEAGGQVIAMDPRTGTVFWRLDVPAVHELAVTHNQKLLYVSRRGANQLAVVELDPDIWVKPDKYIDVLKLDLPDTFDSPPTKTS